MEDERLLGIRKELLGGKVDSSIQKMKALDSESSIIC